MIPKVIKNRIYNFQTNRGESNIHNKYKWIKLTNKATKMLRLDF